MTVIVDGRHQVGSPVRQASSPLVVYVVGRQVRSKTTVCRLPQAALWRKFQELDVHDDLGSNPACSLGIHGRNLIGEGRGVDTATLQGPQNTFLFLARQATSDPTQIRQPIGCRTADEHCAQPIGAVGLQPPAADHHRP